MTREEKVKFIADASGKTIVEVEGYFSHHPDPERSISAMYLRIVEQQGDGVHE